MSVPPRSPPPAPPGPWGAPAAPGQSGRHGLVATGWVRPAPALAGPAAQGAVFASCALAIGLVCTAFDSMPYAVLGAGALAAGIAIGLGTALGRLVERASGLLAALVVGVVMAMLLGVLASQGFALPFISVPLAALFALGLDWRRVDRLRVLPLGCGIFVIAAVGLDRGWAYPAAIAWFAVVLVALWLLEADARRALGRPVPLAQEAAPPAPAPTGDLVRTLGIGLAVGLTAAFLLGNPSCSRPQPDTPDLPEQAGDHSFGGGKSWTPDQVPPGGELGPDDQEVTTDAEGNRIFTDPGSGETYTVFEEDGRQVVRDEDGNAVGEIEDDGVRAGPGDGDAALYRLDDDGRVYTETEDGERLYLDRSGDRTVLRNEDGNVVAEGSRYDDHLHIRVPDGDTVVPDPDGDGQIPVPNSGLTDGALGSEEGRTVEHRDGKTIITDADGERRTYDTDARGRDRVTVEGPHGGRTTYTYDDSGPYPEVSEYADDGRLIARYRYDPDGVIVEPDGGVGAGSEGSSDGGGPAHDTVPADGPTTADEPTPGDEPAEDGAVPWGWILGGIVLVAAALAGGIWLARRHTDDAEHTWAEQQVRRIGTYGEAHHRPRRRTESIVTFTRTLAETVAPDERLPAVGQSLSDALFDRGGIGTERQAWVEATLDEIFEAHPPPAWTDRFHRRDRTPASTAG
ncbi:MAG: hypothetical protein JWM47_192 [Acidimicrobiales bacterium]|nr:hypothetical protein [Acidimicrobiales bacterium]